MAAYAPQAAAALGQLRVAAKTNEHKAAARLLGVRRPLGGAAVAGDAMLTPRDVRDAIRGRGGDSPLFAKDNREALLADITAPFAGPAAFSP